MIKAELRRFGCEIQSKKCQPERPNFPQADLFVDLPDGLVKQLIIIHASSCELQGRMRELLDK
jgi:hypothetical protein